MPLVPVALRGAELAIETVSDQDGAFRFAGLEPGRWALTAGDARMGTAARDRVETGSQDVELVLATPGSIRGRMAVDGPARGYSLRLSRHRDTGDGTARFDPPRVYRFTAQAPTFHLQRLPPGEYLVELLSGGEVVDELPAVEVRPGSETGPVVIGPASTR